MTLIRQSLVVWIVSCSIRFSLAQPFTAGLAMDVMDRSPINGAFCEQPLIDPGVNAWARENLRDQQCTIQTRLKVFAGSSWLRRRVIMLCSFPAPIK
jgi:hypothetical protein